MLRCCVCKIVINDPDTLFKHLKDEHKIKGKNCEVQCTIALCGSKFSDFSSFKKHVLRCFAKMPTNDEIAEEIVDPEMFAYAVDADVLLFQKELNTAALELACVLCAKTNSPRCEIYTTIAEFKKRYITRIISGIKDVMSPRVRPEEEDTVNHFIKAIESSFDDVRSESVLESELAKLGFIQSTTTCEIFETVNKKKKKPRRKRRKRGEGLQVDAAMLRKRRNESEDSEDSEDIEERDETEASKEPKTNIESPIIKGKVTLMPIEFQIKSFFELPNVFEKIKSNTAKLQQEGSLNHFINGKLWKKKLKNYKPDQLVIPFHFYGDGAQMDNPLGPRAKSGEQQLNYYSFPTIPYEYYSRLNNIFVAQSYPAKYHQQFSVEKLYNNIIATFTTLAEDGILLNINGEELNVFFVCGLFIADNKEQNQRLGFVGSFIGVHCCRYCRMEIDDIRTSVNSLDAVRRTRENYDEDVAIDNVTDTGVNEYSPFNRIPFFHVTESSGADLSHDLTEGSLHTSLTKSILHFISKKRFDLEYLNNQMSSIDFGEAEKGNLPTRITEENLKANKFRMTESEMFFFTQNFTLMIGDRVRPNDPVWQHVLTTIKFFDLCYLPSYNEEDLIALRDECENFNQGLKDLFGHILQHKAHLGTHYKDLTEEYGPLRYLKTIRFEGKHREMKSYAKNTNSRVNLGYSLGKKMQFKFALRLMQREGLEDQISIPKYTFGSIENKVYYKRLRPSTQLNEIKLSECFFAKKVIINGIIFATNLWLPNFADSQSSINEIVDILILGLNDINKIFAICRTYTTVTYAEHYVCYNVDMDSLQDEMSLININEFLSQHQYPVIIHTIQNQNLFRCKRF